MLFSQLSELLWLWALSWVFLFEAVLVTTDVSKKETRSWQMTWPVLKAVSERSASSPNSLIWSSEDILLRNLAKMLTAA